MKRSPLRRLKIRIQRRIRDVVCASPRFQGGVIGELKEMLKMETEFAKESLEARKAPEAARIVLESIRLVEVFDIDRYGDFNWGLRRLFPTQEKIHEQVEAYERRAGSLTGGGCTRLGFITDARRPLLMDEQRCVEKLPQNVEAISVSAHDLLPSLRAISFDIKLSQDASAKLSHSIDRFYMPEIEFKTWWPLSKRAGYSVSSPDRPAQRAYFEVLNGIKAETARWLSRYIRGFFFKPDNLASGNIPSAAVFEIRGNPAKEDAFKEWTNTNRGWLEAMHVTPLYKPPFARDGLMFMWPEWTDEGVTPYRLVLRESATKEEDEISKIFVLDSMTAYIAVHEYVGTIRQIIEGSRVSVFSSLAKFKSQLGEKAMKRALEITHCLTLLERVERELGEAQIFSYHLSSLSGFKSVKGGKDLPDVVVDRLRKSTASVRRHVEIMERALSNAISLQNVRATIWLTRVMAVAAFVGLVVSWEQLKPLVLAVWNALMTVLHIHRV